MTFTIPSEAKSRRGRSKMVSVRLTPSELARLMVVAVEADATPSEVLRAALWHVIGEGR